MHLETRDLSQKTGNQNHFIKASALRQGQEGGEVGDKNRILHEYSDGTFEKLMRDMDTHKIKKTQNWFFEHPAYYGTSIQQKVPVVNICRGCAYFRRPEEGSRKKCCFPWKDPKDYDTVIVEFLPCKGRGKNEKNGQRAD